MLLLVRLLITGGSGYLGGELLRRAPAAGWAATGTRLASPGAGPVLDVRDAAAVGRLVADLAPAAVVHTAYRQSGDDMTDVNVAGSANVARAAADAGARLIHLSTDFVFDGEKGGAYGEDDPPAPVTSYGAAKLEAEQRVAAAHPGALLVRTSLLYAGPAPGPHERLVAEAIAGTADVGFFTDELRCPIAVGDLAAALLELLDSDLRGPLHVAGSEVLSRYDFAALVADAAGLDRTRLRPALSAELPVRRPRNCALDCARAAAVLETRLRGASEVLGAAARPIYTRNRWPRP
jgi:dTDP-4-dehydrorhamnose reductase